MRKAWFAAAIAAAMLAVAASSAAAFPVFFAQPGGATLVNTRVGIVGPLGTVTCSVTLNAAFNAGPIGAGGVGGTVRGASAAGCAPAGVVVNFGGLPWNILLLDLLASSGLIGLRGKIPVTVIVIFGGGIVCTYTGNVPFLIKQPPNQQVIIQPIDARHPRLVGAPAGCGTANVVPGTTFNIPNPGIPFIR